jgi:hypothetical protein
MKKFEEFLKEKQLNENGLVGKINHILGAAILALPATVLHQIPKDIVIGLYNIFGKPDDRKKALLHLGRAGLGIGGFALGGLTGGLAMLPSYLKALQTTYGLTGNEGPGSLVKENTHNLSSAEKIKEIIEKGKKEGKEKEQIIQDIILNEPLVNKIYNDLNDSERNTLVDKLLEILK